MPRAPHRTLLLALFLALFFLRLGPFFLFALGLGLLVGVTTRLGARLFHGSWLRAVQRARRGLLLHARVAARLVGRLGLRAVQRARRGLLLHAGLAAGLVGRLGLRAIQRARCGLRLHARLAAGRNGVARRITQHRGLV